MACKLKHLLMLYNFKGESFRPSITALNQQKIQYLISQNSGLYTIKFRRVRGSCRQACQQHMSTWALHKRNQMLTLVHDQRNAY